MDRYSYQVDGAVSLKQMRDRLDQIVRENESEGHPERNELPVIVRARTYSPSGRDMRVLVLGITGAFSGMLTLHGGKAVGDIEAVELNTTWPLKPSRATR